MTAFRKTAGIYSPFINNEEHSLSIDTENKKYSGIGGKNNPGRRGKNNPGKRRKNINRP